MDGHDTRVIPRAAGRLTFVIAIVGVSTFCGVADAMSAKPPSATAARDLRRVTGMRWVPILFVMACAEPPSLPPAPTPPAPTDPTPPAPTPVARTIDGLQPGWHVTVTRLTADQVPIEDTTISDGSPIVLTGDATDVFVATVTDDNGQVIHTHSMKSPCTLAAPYRRDVPRDYPTIQAAIDAAEPGDTVRVAGGTYHEAVKLRAGVCLLGAGAKHTTLDAEGAAINLIDLSSAPGSVVAGFTLRGVAQAAGCARPDDPFACSGNWYRAAVYLGGDNWYDPTNDAPPLVINNVFEDNDVGAMFYWRGVSVLRNNVFVHNRIGFVANHFQDRTLVANNVFVDNAELAIGNQAAYLDIYDNIIVGSNLGVLFQYIQTGHIACNVFWNDGAIQDDIYDVGPRFTIGVDGNVIAEPRFVGNGDYHLHPDSPGHDTGCHASEVTDPDGSPADIGAYGGPMGSWIEDASAGL